MIVLTNLALLAAITSWVFAAFYFAATVALFNAVITSSGAAQISTKTILWRIFYSALATYTGLFLYHVHLELGGWA